jgi:hypothetical protein
VATTTPQTYSGLLAVGPDMSKVLRVVAMSKTRLAYIGFYLDNNVIQAVHLEHLLAILSFLLR